MTVSIPFLNLTFYFFIITTTLFLSQTEVCACLWVWTIFSKQKLFFPSSKVVVVRLFVWSSSFFLPYPGLPIISYILFPSSNFSTSSFYIYLNICEPSILRSCVYIIPSCAHTSYYRRRRCRCRISHPLPYHPTIIIIHTTVGVIQ